MPGRLAGVNGTEWRWRGWKPRIHLYHFFVNGSEGWRIYGRLLEAAVRSLSNSKSGVIWLLVLGPSKRFRREVWKEVLKLTTPYLTAPISSDHICFFPMPADSFLAWLETTVASWVCLGDSPDSVSNREHINHLAFQLFSCLYKPNSTSHTKSQHESLKAFWNLRRVLLMQPGGWYRISICVLSKGSSCDPHGVAHFFGFFLEITLPHHCFSTGTCGGFCMWSRKKADCRARTCENG